MKPSILLLSTYPIKNPLHGGQIRLKNIARAYSDEGMRVTTISTYEPAHYGKNDIGTLDTPFPENSSYRRYYGAADGLASDILAGRYFADDRGGFKHVHANLPAHIDIIHLEQPWLWPVVRRIKGNKKYKNAKVIYGSQNIEARLRKEILESYNINSNEKIVSDIQLLEMEVAAEADISAAVTFSDLITLKSWGAKRTVLAPNGVTPWKATEESVARWRSCLPNAPWILYVASAHPPNFKDFAECIGKSLGCIPPDSKLVVAGGVSQHIYEQMVNTRWSPLNMSRLQLLFILSEEDLAAVKTLAHAYLLPISIGGGSNLKTAEALYSGAHVIGTTTAFRGFEEFIDAPKITAVENSEQMQNAIRVALSCPRTITTKRDETEKLLWRNCLAPLMNNVVALAKERGMINE